jgi:hypothetical protein
VRVVASDLVARLIEEEGGCVYVWLRRARCCGSPMTLEVSFSPPIEKEFRKIEGGTSFELFVPAQLSLLPDELHLDVRRRSRRIEAYWNGCAWVT